MNLASQFFSHAVNSKKFPWQISFQGDFWKVLPHYRNKRTNNLITEEGERETNCLGKHSVLVMSDSCVINSGSFNPMLPPPKVRNQSKVWSVRTQASGKHAACLASFDKNGVVQHGGDRDVQREEKSTRKAPRLTKLDFRWYWTVISFFRKS